MAVGDEQLVEAISFCCGHSRRRSDRQSMGGHWDQPTSRYGTSDGHRQQPAVVHAISAFTCTICTISTIRIICIICIFSIRYIICIRCISCAWPYGSKYWQHDKKVMSSASHKSHRGEWRESRQSEKSH